MPIKYKPVLKQTKKSFNEFYNKFHNPNLTRHQNIQNVINFMAENIAKNKEGKNGEQSSLDAVILKALIDDFNGELIHYFVKDNSLIDFLSNTSVNDISIVNEYIRENQINIDKTVNYYSVALHSEKIGLLITYLFGDDKTVVIICDNDKTIHFLLTDKVSNPLCKLAINLVYYLKAYPDKILDGVPQDMVKNDKHKYNGKYCHSIGIADEVVEKTEVVNGHIITPHFRSGFFRHYTDDRYVNMKGKVQFIAATMVKGKAKTVVA